MTIALFAYHAYSIVSNASGEIVGGMELQLLAMARYLRDRGHRIDILVGDSGQRDNEIVDGINYYRIFDNAIRSPIARMYRIKKVMRHASPEIVLQRGSSNLSGLLCHFAHNVDAKYVYSVASDINCIRSANDPGVTSRIGRLSYNFALRYADAIVVQKESQNELLKRNFGRVGVVVRSLPLHDVKDVPRSNGQKIVWIGNLIPYKKPEVVLEIAQALPQYSFVMVGGDRDQAFSSAIRERAASLSNVDLLGFVALSSIPSILADARILLNTTLVDGQFEEGFPNTFIQAWMSGVPVVSLYTNPDGILTDKSLGRCSRTIEQMKKDILGLMNDDILHHLMSQNAIEYFSQHFNPKSTIDDYEELFNSLLRGHNVELSAPRTSQ